MHILYDRISSFLYPSRCILANHVLYILENTNKNMPGRNQRIIFSLFASQDIIHMITHTMQLQKKTIQGKYIDAYCI